MLTVSTKYTFDGNYYLTQLNKVGAYLKENHHLKGISVADNLMTIRCRVK